MGYADEDGRGTDVTRVLPVFRRAGADGVRVRYADSGRFPDSSWQHDQGQRGQGQLEAEQRDSARHGDSARYEPELGDRHARPDLGQGEPARRGRGQREPAQRSLELHHLGWHGHSPGHAYPVIDWYARYGRYPDDEPGSGY